MLVRRVWIGEPPRNDVARQVDVYRGYASTRATAHWGTDEMVADTDAGTIAQRLTATMRAAGADALNVRCHVPGVGVDAARRQIGRLGDEVLPLLRAAVAAP